MATRNTRRFLTALQSCGALVLLMLSFDVFGKEEFSLFEPVRSLSMGGAHLGIADDDLAVFSNPAGMAKKRALRVSFFDMQMEMSNTLMSSISGYFSGMLSSESSGGLFESLSDDYGKYHYFSTSLVPHLVARNFSFSLLYRTQTALEQSTEAIMNLHRRNDMGALLGVGFPIFGGVIKIGAVGKVIHRAEVDVQTTDGTRYTTFDFDNNYREALGFGADAGLTLTAPIRYFPAISGRIRNIGGMNFSTKMGFYSGSSDDRPAPDEEAMAYDAGYSMVFRFGNDSYVHFGWDYRDIKGLMENIKISTFNGLLWHSHLGMEVMFERIFFIRLGLNQRFPAAGLGIWTKYFALELGAYGVDVGTVEASRGSYRFMGRLELGF